MSDQTPVETTEIEQQTEEFDPFEKSFEDQLGSDKTETEQSEDTKQKPEDADKPQQDDQEQGKEQQAQEQQPEATERLNQLLDTQFKRHDKTQSLRDWIEKEPELLNEVMGQTIDFGAGKAEAKRLEQQTKDYLLKEKEKLDAGNKIIEGIVFENMAYVVDMPPKTLKDFENDVDVDEPEEAFEKYQDELKGKIHQVKQNRAYADSRNEIMFSEFQKQYPDVDINDMASQMQSYLNYAVSKGQTPLPEDTAKVFYQGKNFDRLVKEAVDKAVKAERDKVINELNKKNNNPNIHDAGGDKTKQQEYDADDPFEASFRNAEQYMRKG